MAVALRSCLSTSAAGFYATSANQYAARQRTDMRFNAVGAYHLMPITAGKNLGLNDLARSPNAVRPPSFVTFSAIEIIEFFRGVQD